MRPRLLVLPIAAAIIASLVAWRYHRENRQPINAPIETDRQLAPRFELYDQNSKLVKFERYLGRTELLVVFFDGNENPTIAPILQTLRDSYDELAATGIEVIAISLSTPHAIREAERQSGIDFPFPVLTDIDPLLPIPAPVHRQWGLADDNSADVAAGAFFVDRSGRVEWEDGHPKPLDHLDTFIDQHLTPD